MKGTLYLVATPIGNLEDITLRAIRILQEVDYIAAEDTRHSLKLLNHLQITKPLISYHRHNEDTKSDSLLQKLKEGKNIALISDAGTPGISDPGENIVKKAIEENINIVPIPGACAAINALIVSGLETKSFLFLGFLPLNKKNRKEVLEKIRKAEETCILYEAPHKLKGSLEELEKIIESRRIVLAKELTKIHEEYRRGSVKEILGQIENPKGEYVILVEGKKEKQEEREILSLEEQYTVYEKAGMSKKEIIKKIAKERNVSKNEIYQHFIK